MTDGLDSEQAALVTPVAPGARVTLRDVAREAGVSMKTVSRVINGESKVSPATGARVAEAVERLGYKPNELARSLAGRRSRTIGLMIADISNPFFADCAKGVELVARERGYAVILCASAEDPETEKRYVELLVQRRVDGLLLVPTADGDGEYLAEEQQAGMSIVALDRPVEGIPADAVLVENRAGAGVATRHLVGHGHERIAFVGDAERLYTARERLTGYEEALAEAGLEPLYRLGAADVASADRITRELLRLPEPARPTAFFAGNGLITAGILRALDAANLAVPGDAALVGFDDFELMSALRPHLTAVRQPAHELGRRAAELLFDRLQNGLPRPPKRLVLPAQLVVRGSCGCTDHSG
jgi:LacI family transcriptional regulator